MIQVELYDQKKVLFRQGISELEKIYILKEGTAERFYEDIDQKIITDALHKGDVFGGISIILNESVVIRSLEIQNNTSFYTIPKNDFLSLGESSPGRNWPSSSSSTPRTSTPT